MVDTISPTERPRLIMDTARELGIENKAGDDLVKVQEVLQELRGRGFDLGVQQPLAVIGTVLANADDFRKIARNTFEYIGDPEYTDNSLSRSIGDVEDLPF